MKKTVPALLENTQNIPATKTSNSDSKYSTKQVASYILPVDSNFSAYAGSNIDYDYYCHTAYRGFWFLQAA